MRRANAIPANVPRTVAIRAVPAAATIEVLIASRIVGSVTPVRYPLSPTPLNVTIARPLLNEYATITTIGRNRNT